MSKKGQQKGQKTAEPSSKPAELIAPVLQDQMTLTTPNPSVASEQSAKTGQIRQFFDELKAGIIKRLSGFWYDLELIFWTPFDRSIPPEEKDAPLESFTTARWLFGGVLIFNFSMFALSSINAISPDYQTLWLNFTLWVNGFLLICTIFFAWGQYRLVEKVKGIQQERDKQAEQPLEGDPTEQTSEFSSTFDPSSTPKPKIEIEWVLPRISLAEVFIRFLMWGLGCLMVAWGLSQLLLRLTTLQIPYINLGFTILVIIIGLRAIDRSRIAATQYKDIFKQKEKDGPLTQQRITADLPEWIRQLPLEDVNDKKDSFRLISTAQLNKAKTNLAKKYTDLGHTLLPEDVDKAYTALEKDIEFLNKTLLKVFVQRDYEAKYYQRAYRRYQIGYMVLAVLAGIFGSLLALNLNDSSAEGKRWVAIFGFLETAVALATTYLASISGRENTLEKWLDNRQKAEGLRREYQRYIVGLSPYDVESQSKREEHLKRNLASINLLGEPDIMIDTGNLIRQAAEDNYQPMGEGIKPPEAVVTPTIPDVEPGTITGATTPPSPETSVG